MSHRIGVLSDTHGLLRPEVMEKLKGCERILHGGDVNKQCILDELRQIAPVYAVRGNNDKEWAKELPQTLTLDVFGVKIFMIHNKKQIPENMPEADIILYGHSHKYEENYKEGQLWLNPGSCGPRRFSQPITMAVLEIREDMSYIVEKYEIPHKKTGSPETKEENIPSNIRQVIEAVIRDISKGKSVSEIAERNAVREELAEQICRLYFTHPGVDAEGIMTKMGL